jgi:hypothetical protein
MNEQTSILAEENDGDEAYYSDVREQILAILTPILETLHMIVVSDKRLTSLSLPYRDKNFSTVVGAFHFSGAGLFQSWSRKKCADLLVSAVSFVNLVKAAYPDDHSRMLTVLRRQEGGAFSNLYRNTLSLIDSIRPSVLDEPFPESESIPGQQASSIYAKIDGGRIVLDSDQPLHPLVRKENVVETRDYLRQQFVELSEIIHSSNVDRRYSQSFGCLVDLIDFTGDAGAISFGLHVKLVSQLTKAIEEELPEILAVRIASTLTHAGYFSSQYKDWVEFLRNAQDYPSRQSVDENINDVLEQVVFVLSEPETVDEKIPQSIRLISALLNGSAEDRANAVYAAVRGIENICIAATRYIYTEAVTFLQDTYKKARPSLVRIGAVAIVGVTLSVISSFMPVIKIAPELNWILDNLPSIERVGKLLK